MKFKKDAKKEADENASSKDVKTKEEEKTPPVSNYWVIFWTSIPSGMSNTYIPSENLVLW